MIENYQIRIFTITEVPVPSPEGSEGPRSLGGRLHRRVRLPGSHASHGRGEGEEVLGEPGQPAGQDYGAGHTLPGQNPPDSYHTNGEQGSKAKDTSP